MSYLHREVPSRPPAPPAGVLRESVRFDALGRKTSQRVRPVGGSEPKLSADPDRKLAEIVRGPGSQPQDH